MRNVAEARTKLILFGEHAAVYGYSALGIPLPWKVRVTLDAAAPPDDINLQLLLKKLPELFPEIGDVSSLSITTHSEAPIGVGFGSSGALCVALTKAVCARLHLSPDQQTLWGYAHKLEEVFHNTPSGIDTGISLFEKLCYFEKSPDQLLPTCHTLATDSLCLIIGAVERHSNTKTLVTELRQKKIQDPIVADYIESLGILSTNATTSLLKNDINTFAENANAAHLLLAALNLSTPPLNQMIDYGISQGALGGKLSGAGGGGAYFLITKNPNDAQTIADAMRIFSSEQDIPHLIQPTPHF